MVKAFPWQTSLRTWRDQSAHPWKAAVVSQHSFFCHGKSPVMEGPIGVCRAVSRSGGGRGRRFFYREKNGDASGPLGL